VRLDGGDATAAVWKLGGVPTGAQTVIERASTAAIPGSEHLEALFTAAAERRPVSFPYRGEPRLVDPWRLEFRNGSWYLIGFDHDRRDRRTFRLDRISPPLTAGEAGAFEAPVRAEPSATHPWEMGDEDPVEVEVLVDADQAAWAVANAGARPAWRQNGSVVLTLTVTNRAALRSWVLGFLDHAEILGPPAVRQDMVTWLSGLAAEVRA
jgi:predicted DNA-binding transcriptional regulator YafY